MTNAYYNHGTYPTQGAAGTSAAMRAELDLLTAAFDLLPSLTSNANKLVIVNSGATALGVSAATLTAAGALAGVTTFNGNTWATGTGTLSIAGGKTFTSSNTLTLTATDGSTLAIGTGGTLGTAAYTASTAYQPADADLTTWAGITPGTGVGTALGVNIGSAGAFVVNGGALGTPSSGTLTSCTGLPAAGVTNTAATLSDAQTFITNAKTFTNSLLKLLGSSTGATTFTSDNAGATNYTIHVPAADDTLVTLAATQELDNKTLDASVAKGTWTASGTWTLPALTLGGAVTGNGQNISGLGTVGCGAITTSGILTNNNATDSSLVTNGAVVIAGGVGIGKQLSYVSSYVTKTSPDMLTGGSAGINIKAPGATGYAGIWFGGDYVYSTFLGRVPGSDVVQFGTIEGGAYTARITISNTGINATNIGATTPGSVAATTLSATTTISAGTTIGVGAATPSASGAGITFPATQSASTDANTLDDYEEGTWTAILTCGTSGTITVSGSSVCKYVKIGSSVTLQARVLCSAVSSPVGRVTLGGMPFALGSGNYSAPVYATDMNAFTGSPAITGAGGTEMFVDRDAGTGGSGPITDFAASFTATSSLALTLSYFV